MLSILSEPQADQGSQAAQTEVHKPWHGPTACSKKDTVTAIFIYLSSMQSVEACSWQNDCHSSLSTRVGHGPRHVRSVNRQFHDKLLCATEEWQAGLK